MSDDEIPAVVAIAHLVREAFPDLNGRAFAVAEATLTKENMPQLPLAFIALLNIRAINQSNDVKTPLDIEETICVEFWFKSVNYAKTDGSMSPFYAFQDYNTTMNKLFSALSGYFTPQRKPLRFISMDTMADEYCQTICFKFSVEWRWCVEPDLTFQGIKIKAILAPQELAKDVGGSLYHPPTECDEQGRLPFEGPVLPIIPPPPFTREH